MAFMLFAWITLHSVEKHFAQQDDNDLRQISAALTSILKNSNETEADKIAILKSVLIHYPDIAIILLNREDKTLFQSAPEPDFTAIMTSPSFAHHRKIKEMFLWESTTTQSEPLPTYRILTTSIQNAKTSELQYTLVISLSINFHLHYIDELKSNLILTALTISLLIILIILLAVYKGHQPLRNVSNKIKNISSEDLTVRLDPNLVPIELSQLVISFNLMIERIEDVFTRQANFSADIAHEIRTPIANLLTQTEIALSQPRTPAELEEILESGLEEYYRLAKMITDMLFLSQADNNQLIPDRSLLDLKTEISKVIDYFEIVAEDKGILLTLSGDSVFIRGDSLMIGRVINNLLSNALRYTPEGKTIAIKIKKEENGVTLIVENPGTPIASEHLPRIFDRLYRIDPSRQRNGEGSGIGLAIVKSIMTAHHGKIHVESDIHSTRFIMFFPLSK